MILTSIIVAGAMTPAVTVQQGDTYKSIAQENNVTIAQLEQANNREIGGFDIIYPNDNVIIPNDNKNSVEAKNTTNNDTPAPQTQSTYDNFKVTYYDPMIASAGTTSIGYNAVAVDFSIFPRGTQLKITLSSGEVLYRTALDTGEFIYSNSHQLDIAMPNSQIYSQGRGVDTATVEVL